MLSESAHSAIDLIASVITLFSVQVADRPADEDHNYGHGKVESLSAFVETGIMFASCIWIVAEAVRRIIPAFHDHHDLSLATMHVHLDHESCLEVAVLRGEMSEIRHFAEHVISERGVRHGRLVAVPVEVADESHPHGAERGRRHLHTHVREAS